jgi:hypothetical protein
VLLQQGEIHLAIYALALCLDAAALHCRKQRCPTMTRWPSRSLAS